MDEFKYRYLFPYEKVPVSSKILIYGAGNLGQDYLLQMQITKYCEVVAMADKNFKNYPSLIVPVIDPETISEWEFDYIVIALRAAVAEEEILRVLRKQGISDEKVICIFERPSENISLSEEKRKKTEAKEIEFAYDNNEQSIALLITGGWGDHVIQKRLVMEIISLAPGIPIDIYAIRHVDFLKYLYSDCKTIHNVIEDLGVRYCTNYRKYSFSMSIEACHYLRIDEFKEKLLHSGYPEFVRRLKILEKETLRDPISLNIPVKVSNMRRQFQGLDAYSGFSYNGAFDLSDKNISFPVTDSGEAFFRSLKLQKYITVNYGNGECQDGRKVAKTWPLSRFSEVVSMMKEGYPDIAVIQLGASGAARIADVDRYILGESIERVASVLKHVLFHLDIEGGLVHIASQIGTKCIVLFGPTVEDYYGYKENIHIRAGNCRHCWGLYSDVNRCARNMTEPECMYSISPELVMKHVESYLTEIGYQA